MKNSQKLQPWKIGGDTYIVREDNTIDDENLDGKIVIARREISITSRSLENDLHFVDCILHELNHGILDFMNVEFENGAEEDRICESVAHITKMIMADNIESIRAILNVLEAQNMKGKK